MKYLFISTLLSFVFCVAACSKTAEVSNLTHDLIDSNQFNNNKMNIKVGSAIFTATLYDNPSANALKVMLPLTINMSELNANEKFYYFSSSLPTNAARGGNIQVGDFLLYGNNCLVLFYENIQTTYSYARLGKIDNTSGLKAALGTGSITATFEIH